jgi:hypothetical protein
MGSKPETLIALEQAISDKAIDANKFNIWDCNDGCFAVIDKTTKLVNVSIEGGIFKLKPGQISCLYAIIN